MKFVPKELKENVNIRNISPLREAAELVIKTVVVIVALYIALGLAVGLVVPHISAGTEAKFGKLFSQRYASDSCPEQSQRLQEIVDRLAADAAGLPGFSYKVHVVADKQINALALPAGNIVVFTGLLEKAKSENEVAMVLAHELGHFAHRDHLRGLGRGLVFLALSSALFGADSSVSRAISNAMNSAEMRFSQAQEQAADLYALEAVFNSYGHAAGALDFYERMAQKERGKQFWYLLASHPYPQRRVLALKQAIKERSYPLSAVIPFAFDDCLKKSGIPPIINNSTQGQP